MSDIPWFMLSPSPVSLIQYAILTWIMWSYFLRAGKYEKHSRILSLIDSFFVVAFFVVLTDAFWVSFSILKWLPLYPQDALQIYASLGRDLLAALLFGMFIWDNLKQKVISFNFSVIFWLCISFLFQAAWFFFAGSPGVTDYTFAWRHGYPLEFVLIAWSLSHVLMRIPLWAAIMKTRSPFYA